MIFLAAFFLKKKRKVIMYLIEERPCFCWVYMEGSPQNYNMKFERLGKSIKEEIWMLPNTGIQFYKDLKYMDFYCSYYLFIFSI